MQAPESDWVAALDAYTTAQGFEFANIVWPGATDALADNWPALASLLAERSIASTDMGGFVPGGMQEYDARSAPNFTAGTVILGERFLGLDMGEQDVRFLWGYNANANLIGPVSRFESLVAFRDFSDAIEVRSALKLGALASSTYGVHHWLKSGYYTNAGAETSQTNGFVHRSRLRCNPIPRLTPPPPPTLNPKATLKSYMHLYVVLRSSTAHSGSVKCQYLTGGGTRSPTIRVRLQAAYHSPTTARRAGRPSRS